jgi:predicted transcriptional regulator
MLTDEDLGKARAELDLVVERASSDQLETRAIVEALADGPQVFDQLRETCGLPKREFQAALDSLWRGGLVEITGTGEDVKVSLTETGSVVAQYA